MTYEKMLSKFNNIALQCPDILDEEVTEIMTTKVYRNVEIIKITTHDKVHPIGHEAMVTYNQANQVAST